MLVADLHHLFASLEQSVLRHFHAFESPYISPQSSLDFVFSFVFFCIFVQESTQNLLSTHHISPGRGVESASEKSYFHSDDEHCNDPVLFLFGGRFFAIISLSQEHCFCHKAV